jgi:hypothetical protein
MRLKLYIPGSSIPFTGHACAKANKQVLGCQTFAHSIMIMAWAWLNCHSGSNQYVLIVLRNDCTQVTMTVAMTATCI